MKGTIAQIVALTTWGNAALDELVLLDGASFYPSNSTFVFCEYVKFVDVRKNGAAWEEVSYASDPLAWFKRIRQEGTYTLRLIHGPSNGVRIGSQKVPDRMLAGFIGGGGRWLIEAVKPGESDYWEARWEVGERDREDQKIWRVTYGRIAANAPSSEWGRRDSAEEVKRALAANLSKIAEFARVHNEERFAKVFDSALVCLTSPRPLEGLFHADITPKNVLAKVSEQLLGAVITAWVFGGMGSWNDLGFEGDDQVQYGELSEELYRLLNLAILVATNSSARNAPTDTTRGCGKSERPANKPL